MADTAQPAKWQDAFPAPCRTAAILPRSTALANLASPELLVVDVRRTDYEGGTLRGSLNIPAHSFYFNRAVLYDLCKRAGVKQVAFYCGSCSAGGRGQRCSGWFGDYLAEKGEEEMQVLTLEGGIKAWVKSGDEYTQQMDGYDAEFWKKQFA